MHFCEIEARSQPFSWTISTSLVESLYDQAFIYGKHCLSQADGKQLSDPSDAVHLLFIQRVEIRIIFSLPLTMQRLPT
jgi:hypothetical protein